MWAGEPILASWGTILYYYYTYQPLPTFCLPIFVPGRGEKFNWLPHGGHLNCHCYRATYLITFVFVLAGSRLLWTICCLGRSWFVLLSCFNVGVKFLTVVRFLLTFLSLFSLGLLLSRCLVPVSLVTVNHKSCHR